MHSATLSDGSFKSLSLSLSHSFSLSVQWLLSPVPNAGFIAQGGVQVGCTTIIIVFNVLLFSVTPLLTAWEGHHTRSTEEGINTCRFIFFQV